MKYYVYGPPSRPGFIYEVTNDLSKQRLVWASDYMHKHGGFVPWEFKWHIRPYGCVPGKEISEKEAFLIML